MTHTQVAHCLLRFRSSDRDECLVNGSSREDIRHNSILLEQQMSKEGIASTYLFNAILQTCV